MMKLIISVLPIFMFLASCDANTLVDYRLALSKTANPPKNCTSSGKFCESCTDLVVCIHTDDTWTKTNVETCDSGKKCIKGACTTDPDPFCDGTADLAFPCQKAGIFPDPFYCNKFVLCVSTDGKLHAYLNKCEEGLGYNIATGLCDIKLENGVCKTDEYPLPLCVKAGDSAALPNKPSEYYTCQEYSSTKAVLYPVIDVCPQAASYDSYKCGN